MNPLLTLRMMNLAELIQTRKISPLEVTQAFIAQVERVNPRLTAQRKVIHTAPAPPLSLGERTGEPAGVQCIGAVGPDALTMSAAEALQASQGGWRPPPLVKR